MIVKPFQPAKPHRFSRPRDAGQKGDVLELILEQDALGLLALASLLHERLDDMERTRLVH
jgi:hypothetical protein